VAQATSTVAITIDDFEDETWPRGSPWQLAIDPEDPRTTSFLWSPRTCRAASGTRSLWAVGGGEGGQALACGDPYPPNVRSTVALSLDLRPYGDARVLRLAFEFWANTISDAALGDFFSINYLVPDAEGFVERVVVLDWTGATGSAFRTERLDLLDLADVHDAQRRFNLAGKEVVLEFVFRSQRDSTTRPAGVFVDLVRIERDGVPTPGPSPTRPATAAATTAVPPSSTAIPSATIGTSTPATQVTPTASVAAPPPAYMPVARRRR
jgi:hypothetical protein